MQGNLRSNENSSRGVSVKDLLCGRLARGNGETSCRVAEGRTRHSRPSVHTAAPCHHTPHLPGHHFVHDTRRVSLQAKARAGGSEEEQACHRQQSAYPSHSRGLVKDLLIELSDESKLCLGKGMAGQVLIPRQACSRLNTRPHLAALFFLPLLLEFRR